MNIAELQKKNITELHKTAAKKNIENYKHLKKQDLIFKIIQDEINQKKVVYGSGVLDILAEGYGFLRTTNYTSGPDDIYVSPSQIKRFDIREGDTVSGQIRPPKENENYFAIISILKYTHTYKNILREKEFCLNFPDYRYIENCFNTIKNNELNVNEIENSGFTIEDSKKIDTPRIKECFLNMECMFAWEKEYFKNSQWIIICGKIIHIAMENKRLKNGLDGRYSDLGYIYNIHSPKNPINGESCDDEVGKIEVLHKE